MGRLQLLICEDSGVPNRGVVGSDLLFKNRISLTAVHRVRRRELRPPVKILAKEHTGLGW